MTASLSSGARAGDPLKLLAFSTRRRVPLIMQTEVAECGLACLAMVANYHGHRLDLPALRQRIGAGSSGMTLQEMIELADGLSLVSRALKCPVELIDRLRLPCVLHWDMNHFVVLTAVGRRRVTIHDPALGRQTLRLKELFRHYTGVALELSPAAGFTRLNESRRMSLRQLWSGISGLGAGLAYLVILSLIIQLFALAMPYYLQWVVDEVLLSRDSPLLRVLAIGFGMLVILRVCTTAIRGHLVLRLSSMLNMQLGVNLCNHLLKLPMRYFEQRHVGDVVARFGSLAAIREQLTSGFATAVVDGLMAFAVLLVMFVYASQLALVVLAAIGLYTLLRCWLYQPLQRATEESIRARAKEQSNFLENLRGIQTIKLFTAEPLRLSVWQHCYAELINAEIRLGRLTISFETARSLLFGLENVIVIYLAATMVMAGSLTVGMVLAFAAYKTQFIDRMAELIEQLVAFRMLRLHLDRISDIALEDTEACREPVAKLDRVRGRLELQGISFRYGAGQPWVLRELSLTVEPGECVALSGPSGCGKTTLMKIMLGLLEPEEGRVLLDGEEITRLGLLAYRRQVAAVMQDDTLLTGSVLDNLCFFDPQPEPAKVRACARRAAVDADIAGMPMGYHSLVGDMGNEFSGGQVQRLLLARALYQDPKVLFMDEATSHLDGEREACVAEQLRQLAMTRILIAHRPDTLCRADRVLLMEDGRLVSPPATARGK